MHRIAVYRCYLSSKLRSMSNWKIEIRLGESSMLSPLLAFSYIFSPPTYHKAVITCKAQDKLSYKLTEIISILKEDTKKEKCLLDWMRLTKWIKSNTKLCSNINQVFRNDKQKSYDKISHAELLQKSSIALIILVSIHRKFQI